MRGFEWQSQRGIEGTGFVRALRSLLTSHLPILFHELEHIVNDGIKAEFKRGIMVDGTRWACT
jgi:hypothetical protein